jgi:hypothetical protein
VIKIIIGIIFFGSSYVHAENKSLNCSLTSESINTNITSDDKLCLENNDESNQRLRILDTFLHQDLTDIRKYITLSEAKGSDKKWFVCQQFSSQLYLRGSCLSSKNQYKIYEEKTSIEVSNRESSLKNKLPIFSVNLKNTKIKYFHQINALFVGDKASDLKDINNYVFVEPQTDRTYRSIEEYKKSSISLARIEDLQVKILKMGKPGTTSNGDLQYNSQEIVRFKCSINE